MPWIVAVLVAALVAGGLGFSVGRRPDRPASDSVAVGFLYDMVEHHDQALRMSNLVLMSGGSPEVAVFAREILRFQSFEIGAMRRQLEVWGYSPEEERPAMAWMGHAVPPGAMPGMATDAELDRLLAAAGAEADALFIALMQDHHRGGVAMASEAEERAESAYVRDIAGRMARAQATEITELDTARVRLGLPADPPGFTPSAGEPHA